MNKVKKKRAARSFAQRRETIHIVLATKRCPRNRMFLANGTEIRGVAGFEATFDHKAQYLDVTSIHSPLQVVHALPTVDILRVELVRPRIVYAAKRPPKK